MLGDIDLDLKNDEIITLLKPDRTEIKELSSYYDLRINLKFALLSEISFKIPYKINNKINTEWDLIDGDLSLKLLFNGEERYFVIKKIEVSDDEEKYSEITGYSLAVEFTNKYIRSYEGVKKLYDISNPEEGILNHIIQLCPSWSIGTIDDNTKFRTFNISQKTVLDFLLTDVSKAFECIFLFDEINKVINVKTIENIGQDRGLYIDSDTLLERLGYEIKYDEIVTRLYCYGENDLTFNDVNPTGTNFLESYIYYKNTKYMEQSLIDAINNYEQLIENNTPLFNTYLSELNNLQADLNVKNAELTLLRGELNVIQDAIDIKIEMQEEYTTLHNDKINKQTEIDNKIIQINGIQTDINNKISQIISLRNTLKRENNFTTNQIKRLDELTREQEYRNTNHTNTSEFFEHCKGVMQKATQPPVLFDINMVNFVKLVEYQHSWHKLRLGDLMTVKHNDYKIDILIRLTGIEYSFDDSEISLIFSNKNSYDDPLIQINDILGNAIYSGTTLDIERFKYGKYFNEERNDLLTFINSELDSARNAVLAGEKQSILINERGINLSKDGEPNEQLRMLNNLLVMTEDNWATASLAISPKGIIANKLIGKILIGTELLIENSSNTFSVNATGVTISGGSLTITGGLPTEQLSGSFVEQDTFYNRVKISSTDGIQVFDNQATPVDRIKIGQITSSLYGIRMKNRFGNITFDTDSDGNLSLTGIVKARDFQDLSGNSFLRDSGTMLAGGKINAKGIEVKNASNQVTFGVDENGNVTISGDVTMTGGSISWSSVTAPSYGEITGTKPDEDADNTASNIPSTVVQKIGGDYTYLDKNRISSPLIEGGTIIGSTIKTNIDGNDRLILSGNGIESRDGLDRLHGININTSSGSQYIDFYRNNVLRGRVGQFADNMVIRAPSYTPGGAGNSSQLILASEESNILIQPGTYLGTWGSTIFYGNTDFTNSNVIGIKAKFA